MEAAIGALVGIVVLVCVFWLCRELFCWYWKLNAIVAQSEQQTLELIAIKKLLRQLVEQGAPKGSASEEIKE